MAKNIYIDLPSGWFICPQFYIVQLWWSRCNSQTCSIDYLSPDFCSGIYVSEISLHTFKRDDCWHSPATGNQRWPLTSEDAIRVQPMFDMLLHCYLCQTVCRFRWTVVFWVKCDWSFNSIHRHCIPLFYALLFPFHSYTL